MSGIVFDEFELVHDVLFDLGFGKVGVFMVVNGTHDLFLWMKRHKHRRRFRQGAERKRDNVRCGNGSKKLSEDGRNSRQQKGGQTHIRLQKTLIIKIVLNRKEDKKEMDECSIEEQQGLAGEGLVFDVIFFGDVVTESLV